MKTVFKGTEISKVISRRSLFEKSDDREYWLSKSYEERLEALELLRQIFYNYDPSTTRLQRIIESVKLKKS